ncbi:MAG: hypothetical protein IJ168_11325 [Eubacterium sp.]|nr:hypothetical protein [Eubacterium sp.]
MKRFLNRFYWILLPLLITAVLLLLKAVQYDSADDVFLYEMANSFATNAHSEHLMFMSVLYGYLYRAFYLIMPTVNWFSLSYLTLHCCQFMMLYKTVQRHGSYLPFVTVLAGLEVYLLHRISFTGLSFIGVTVGIIWLLDRVDSISKKNIKHIVLSFVMIGLSFGMRSGNTFIFALLIFMPINVMLLIRNKKRLPVIAVLLVLLTVANYTVQGIQKYYVSTIPADSYYAEFQEYRSAATDGGVYDYDNHREALEAAGVSENDYQLYRNYIYLDKTAFSKDKIKAISERDFSEQYDTDKTHLWEKLQEYDIKKGNWYHFHHYLLYYFLFALILFVLHKNKRLDIFLSAGFTAAAELYLFFRRRPVPRVVNPIAILGMIILLFIVLDDKGYLQSLKAADQLSKKRIYRCSVLILLAVTTFLSGLNIYIQKTTEPASYEELYQTIDEDTEHIYLSYSQTRNQLMDKHLTLSAASYRKIPINMIFGDWQGYTYYWYDLLQCLELEAYADHSMEALLDDRVLFVCKNKSIPDYLVEYFKEHEDLNVSYVTVSTTADGSLTVYDFNVEV